MIIGYKKSGYSINANPLIGIEKKCAKCGEIKPCSEFYKRGNRNLYRSHCKKCMKISSGDRSLYNKEYYEQHKKELQITSRNYYAKNKQKCASINKIWRDKNPDKIKALQKKMNAKRRGTITGKLHSNISKLIWETLKGVKNNKTWVSLVGYNTEELKTHLEKQFKDGMTWENYGKWHIDHKRPIHSFNFINQDDDDFKQCWSLSNLQPLWAKDNIRKGAKWEGK
jgi:hypothetical protein